MTKRIGVGDWVRVQEPRRVTKVGYREDYDTWEQRILDLYRDRLTGIIEEETDKPWQSSYQAERDLRQAARWLGAYMVRRLRGRERKVFFAPWQPEAREYLVGRIKHRWIGQHKPGCGDYEGDFEPAFLAGAKMIRLLEIGSVLGSDDWFEDLWVLETDCEKVEPL